VRPALRLPLQIGTTSLWGMTRGALLLVPGILVAPVGLVLGATIAWVGGEEISFGIGATLAIAPLVFIAFAVAQLGAMIRARASDVVLDAEGVHIDGGVHGGTRVPWAELAPERCTLEHEAEAELTKLVVARADGTRLVLAEAEAPEERESLAALHASLHAGAWPSQAGAKAQDMAPDGAEIVRCPGCGVAVVPDVEPTVKCHRCETAVELPPDVRAKVRAEQRGKQARGAIASLVTRLVEQPGATRINLTFVLGGAAMILAWPASIAIGAWAWSRDDLDGLRVLSLLVFPLALIPGIFMLLRATLVDRFALRLLTLELGAKTPTRDGDPFGCRACSGPLVVAEGEVVVRCVYCEADNVLGLDLRGKTQREQSSAKSLGDALAWRTKERRRWRLWLVPAVLSTALGGALLHGTLRPAARTHALDVVGGVLERVTTHPADEHSPSVRGDEIAFVELRDEARVVVAPLLDTGDRRIAGQGGEPAWDTDGALLGLGVGKVARLVEPEDAKSMPITFGLDVARIQGRGALGVTFIGGRVGIATTAEIGQFRPDGGHARAGTLGRDAAVSADGLALAFVRDIDGVPQILSTEVGAMWFREWTSDAAMKSEPTWSPDARRLVWVVDDGTPILPRRNLWIGADDGSQPRALTTGDADAHEPDWADDGWVYFAARAFGRNDIFRVRPDDVALGAAASVQPVLRPGPAATVVERITDDISTEHDPRLSPDGHTLAYAQTRSVDDDITNMVVVVRDMATGAEHSLVQSREGGLSLQWARSPTFTPDGAQLVFVLADDFVTLRRVPVHRPASDAEKVLDANASTGSFVRPRVSPDGGSIAVERRARSSDPWALVVIASDGAVTELGVGRYAEWRADGRALVFVQTHEDRGRAVIVTLDDPTHPQPIALGDHDVRAIAWHPDGRRWIVESRRGPTGADLVVVDDRGGTELVVEGEGDHGRHFVGSDGWLYFTSDAMGQLDVWRAKLR
jgi:Tol biopolymer transport system component